MEFHAYWDYRVAIDLFLGGVGIGIFLITAYFCLVQKEKSIFVSRIGLFISPVLVGLGVFALMTELGRPFRMLLTFINVNPTSVTSWGGFLQTIFILLSFASFFFVFKYKTKAFELPVFKGLLIAGSIFALAVGVYHGLLLMSLGRAGWASGLIPVMFLVSSILAGSSFLILLEAIVTKFYLNVSQEALSEIAATTEKQTSLYNKLLVTLVAIQALLVITWRISINSAGMEAIFAYQNLVDHYGVYWWIFVVGLGLIVPLLIATYYLMTKKKMNISLAILFTTVVLIGSYTFKHIILYSGQIPLAGL